MATIILFQSNERSELWKMGYIENIGTLFAIFFLSRNFILKPQEGDWNLLSSHRPALSSRWNVYEILLKSWILKWSEVIVDLTAGDVSDVILIGNPVSETELALLTTGFVGTWLTEDISEVERGLGNYEKKICTWTSHDCFTKENRSAFLKFHMAPLWYR